MNLRNLLFPSSPSLRARTTIKALLLGVAAAVGLTCARLGVRSVMTAATRPSSTFSVAYVTVPDETAGRQLAKQLVGAKLAACVNVVPRVVSVYEWEGKLEEDAEAMLIIKTRSSVVDRLSEFVRQNHPYDVPEVIAMPIENGNEAYLDWLGKAVPEKSS